MDATTYHVAGLGSGGLDALAMTPNMEVMALLMLVLAWLVVIIPTIGMAATVDQPPRPRHCSQCGAGPDTGYPSTAAHERPNGARTCRNCHNPAEPYLIQDRDGANPLPLYITNEWVITPADTACAEAEIENLRAQLDVTNRVNEAWQKAEDVTHEEAGAALDQARENLRRLRDDFEVLHAENAALQAAAEVRGEDVTHAGAALARLTSTIRAVLTLKLNRVDLLDSDVEVWLGLVEMCEQIDRGAGL